MAMRVLEGKMDTEGTNSGPHGSVLRRLAYAGRAFAHRNTISGIALVVSWAVIIVLPDWWVHVIAILGLSNILEYVAHQMYPKAVGRIKMDE
jgi:hypothetical protein